MRPIKFRAWDIKSKYWIPWEDLLISRDGLPCYYDTNKDINVLDDVILQQYTGMNDKNGKEIWEGDIVLDGCDAFEIKYSTNCDQDCGPGFDFQFYRNNQFQVVGNIFEHPELLEGK